MKVDKDWWVPVAGLAIYMMVTLSYPHIEKINCPKVLTPSSDYGKLSITDTNYD